MTSAPNHPRAGPVPRNPRRWPLGLIGMLALVAAVERTVARNEIRFTTVETSAWAQRGAHLTKAARSAVIGFGDSLVMDGIVPPVLEARHGLTAWNLAMPGGTAPAHHFLLRRLLRSGARPAAVLVDGEALRDDPLAQARVWSELARPAELADLALAGRDPAFLARTLLARGLATYRARAEIRLSIVRALSGKTLDARWSLAGAWRNWNANRGAFVLTDQADTPGDGPRLVTQARTGHLWGAWKCHPVNDAYVRRFLDIADAHGVAVFWLIPPSNPELQARREQFGWDPDYVGYLRRLQERYPRLTVIDGRHAGYPPEVLADVLHLSRTAAIYYTDSVGTVLRDSLAARARGPRWVELPRYSATAAAELASASTTVEDVDQSARALWRRTDKDRRRR